MLNSCELDLRKRLIKSRQYPPPYITPAMRYAACNMIRRGTPKKLICIALNMSYRQLKESLRGF